MWSIRKTPERIRRVKALADAIMEDPTNITKVIDYALSFTISANATLPTAPPDPRELTIAQALTLADIAADIAEKVYTGPQPPTILERIELYEQLNPMPPWYTDNHRSVTMEIISRDLKEG